MTVTNCLRCHVRCRLGPSPNPEALLLRYAKTAGYCPNCALTDWLKRHVTREAEPWGPHGNWMAPMLPDGLALPHIRELIVRCVLVGKADMKPHEIDWDEVVANWHLPFPEKVKRKD